MADLYETKDYYGWTLKATDLIKDKNERKVTKDLLANFAFDNGDSQSTILLGQQGAQIEITINNATSPLKAFVSGNFEINNDNLTILTDVLEKLGSI